MYVSMRQMLEKANAENYAVMAINCFNLETARAVISAAEEEQSPIIINIFWEHLLTHSDSELIAPLDPRADETPDSYWDYFRTLRDATAPLPLVAFALASEQVNFKSIFRN